VIKLRVRSRFDLVQDGHARAAFVPVVRRGELYDLGGETVELFRIRVLAEAFDRNVRTLKAWEQAGWLPRPLFHVMGSTHRRYSGAQITNAHRLVWARWRQRRHLLNGEMRSLFDSLGRVWLEPAVVVQENGEIDDASLVIRATR